jgi:hypothetical protein
MNQPPYDDTSYPPTMLIAAIVVVAAFIVITGTILYVMWKWGLLKGWGL